jgi:hypothetical protein
VAAWVAPARLQVAPKTERVGKKAAVRDRADVMRPVVRPAVGERAREVTSRVRAAGPDLRVARSRTPADVARWILGEWARALVAQDQVRVAARRAAEVWRGLE